MTITSTQPGRPDGRPKTRSARRIAPIARRLAARNFLPNGNGHPQVYVAGLKGIILEFNQLGG